MDFYFRPSWAPQKKKNVQRTINKVKMKKKNFLFASMKFVLVSAVVLMACSKDRIEQDLNTYESPNQYLDAKKQDEQIFVIDTSGTGPIVGNQGTTIWGSIDCLEFANGDSVDYPFIVKLVELYSAKDMIYYQMPTISANKAIQSAGEIRLRAEKNGMPLQLMEGCAFKVSMPSDSALPNFMTVFYGDEAVSPLNWRSDLSFFGITPLQNSIFEIDTIGYSAFIERLGWINADRLINGSLFHTISFESDVDDLTNVAIFAYLPETHSVLQKVGNNINGIPDGVFTKVLALALGVNGELFYYYQELEVNGSQTLNISLSPTTDQAFTQLLDGL